MERIWMEQIWQANSNGLQPNSNGLQPKSDGLQAKRMAMALLIGVTEMKGV